jgi:hypothetical protein
LNGGTALPSRPGAETTDATAGWTPAPEGARSTPTVTAGIPVRESAERPDPLSRRRTGPRSKRAGSDGQYHGGDTDLSLTIPPPADIEALARQLRRRREASYRLPPLPDGRRDPLDPVRRWAS